MDTWLFWSQNRWAGWGYWPDYLAWFLAVWGLGVLALLVVLRWLFPGARPRCEQRTALLAAVGAIFAVGLAELPMIFWYRERPFVALDGAFNLLATTPSDSFPSVHGAAGFTIATIMGWESQRWGWLTWPLALGMAWGRIYGGVHYPSDMLVSLMLSFLVGWTFMELGPDLQPALDRIVSVLPYGSRQK